MHNKGFKKTKKPVKKIREDSPIRNDSLIVEKSVLYQVGDVAIQLPANHMLPFYQQHHKNYDKFLPHLVNFSIMVMWLSMLVQTVATLWRQWPARIET